MIQDAGSRVRRIYYFVFRQDILFISEPGGEKTTNVAIAAKLQAMGLPQRVLR
jgi:hypothetical protein